jgi:hypothetical protein
MSSLWLYDCYENGRLKAVLVELDIKVLIIGLRGMTCERRRGIQRSSDGDAYRERNFGLC